MSWRALPKELRQSIIVGTGIVIFLYSVGYLISLQLGSGN